MGRLGDLVARWVAAIGVSAPHAPKLSASRGGLLRDENACRPGAGPDEIEDWERRHGYRLPDGLRAWLLLSDGLYRDGAPLIHPLSAIGPMVPFASVPGLVVQPESWFELGNPNVETICIDLGYHWPAGGPPIFTSGDDLANSPPRVIAPSFEDWFLALLREDGREYWFEPGFQPLGHPWQAHRDHTPVPPLPGRLGPLAARARTLMRNEADDRSVASALGISRGDVETLFRHLQHGPDSANGT